MDTLLRDSDTTATLPGPAQTLPEATPGADAPARACGACGAAMAPAQDWCLACGTAAPGRLGRRPGLRAAATVIGLTLALVAGAATAGYAALSADAGRNAAAPAGPDATPIAQAPPATPSAPAPAAPPAKVLPKVKPPKSIAPPPVAPVAPAPTPPVVPATPTHTSPPPTHARKKQTPAQTKTGPTTGPKTPALTPIVLATGAGTLYDPSARATDKIDPALALDGDPATGWTVTTADAGDIRVGFAVDLGTKQVVKAIRLHTSTPGFRVELYETGAKDLPPAVLDPRWNHVLDRADVAATERISLRGATIGSRHVLLWITTPPKAAPSVTISELELLR